MKENVIRFLENNISNFTGSEKIIADYFIKKRDMENLKITDISKKLYVSTATISRFVNKIGYKNYKEFIYEFGNSLDDLASMADNDKFIVDSLWKTHKDLYSDIYNSIGTIDLKFIANKLINCEEVYFYCFGDMYNLMDLFVDRIRPLIPESHKITYYEHLFDKAKADLGYNSLLVLFYQSNVYDPLIKNIIATAKKRFIPVIIISISQDVDTQNYAHLIKLFPSVDKNTSNQTISVFTPLLVFMEALYNAIKVRRERNKKIYTGYF